jgi:hypothetical protein
MKKILVAVALLTTAFGANAQDKSIRIGVFGNFNSVWLFNKNVSDAAGQLNPDATFGGSFGIGGTYMINQKLGIELNLLSTSAGQKYSGDFPSTSGLTGSYTDQMKLKYIEIPLLLKLTSEKGPYFEFGPDFNFLSSASETLTTSAYPKSNYTDKDFKDNFNSSNIAALLGFGVDIKASDNVLVTVGLRLAWGLSDVTKQFDQNAFNVLNDANLDSGTSYFAHHKDPFVKGETFDYKATNTAIGGLHVGVVYVLKGK